MKCQLVIALQAPNPDGERLPNITLPVGHVVDHPEAYRLVRHGVANPLDDECRRWAGMTPEQIAAAQHAYRRVEKGIAPEDYAAFDAGEMLGYDDDGEWVPGPNYTGEPEDEEDYEFSD